MADLKMLSTPYKKALSSRPWETRAKHAKQRKIQLESRLYWHDFCFHEFSFADDFLICIVCFSVWIFEFVKQEIVV